MSKAGPFFYINKRLIYNACALSEARKQADKLDNSYGHDKLYDSYFNTGDYIDYPRGRVVWDITNERSIIYIDRCINKPVVIAGIVRKFELDNYVVEADEHYRCINCSGGLWED